VKQERRVMPRYRIDAEIQIDDGTGSTINLSGNGVFFETARHFAPGQQVALVFPFDRNGAGAVVTCDAQVVRIEPRGGYFGVAATYEPVRFTVPR
jgi:PilZ domain